MAPARDNRVYRLQDIDRTYQHSVKHAGASDIRIALTAQKQNLAINFEDNGKGFDYEELKMKGKGFGLLNLEERIKKINGQYQYFSAKGQGVKVNIELNLA
ncbi:MAG: hypothetical protein HC896_16290 [Bacteroidales bacterium]|nr:hypothetical protein [Bacteroidales bacterium]